MAGALNGVAGQTQIPLSQPSQLGQTAGQIRQGIDREPEQNRVQPQGSAAAETQTANGNESRLRSNVQQQADEIRAQSSEGSDVRRGSVIDVLA